MSKKILFSITIIIVSLVSSAFFVKSINQKQSSTIVQNKPTQKVKMETKIPEVAQPKKENFPSGITETKRPPLIKVLQEKLLEKKANSAKELPRKNKPFSFVVIGDAENYKTPSHFYDVLEYILIKSKSLKPDFAFFTGDILVSDSPDRARLANAKRVIEKYYKTFYVAVGKHDVECGKKCVSIWQSVFNNNPEHNKQKGILYYSFDYENTHFVVLSSDYPIKHSIDSKQLLWLDNDLAHNTKENLIVVVHVPPVTFFKKSAKACHDMSCSETRERLMSILDKYHVDLVLSGHEHVFDHKIVNGIDFVLAGNSGNSKRYKNSTWGNIFSYITISNHHIILKAIDEKGSLIREITIK